MEMSAGVVTILVSIIIVSGSVLAMVFRSMQKRQSKNSPQQ